MLALQVNLVNLGKKFNREWIFKGLNFEFTAGSSCVFLGGNGSGKSTLLQLIAGNLTPSEGYVTFTSGQNQIGSNEVYLHISLAAPYLELIEEYSLIELYSFHNKFKPFINALHPEEVFKITGLKVSSTKQIRHFSSGMKQRVKLALAILSDAPVILLDEPASNLDSSGIDWYLNLIEKYKANRTVIVCSNKFKHEYEFCTQSLNLTEFRNYPA
jgi:ABC-type multidrug transport system ATPase subunit